MVLQARSNTPIDSLRVKLIEESKKSFQNNDETFILTRTLLTSLSKDSISLILKSLPADRYKAFALSYFAYYQLKYTPAISLPWLEEAKAIATTSNDPKLWYWVHRHHGFYYHRIEKVKEALRHFIISNQFAEKSNFARGRVINLVHFAEVYQSMGNYKQAFKYAFTNIEARKNYPPDFGFGFAYFFLGNLYASIEDYPEAIDKFSQGGMIFTSIGDLNYTGVMLGAKAQILKKQNLLDSALVALDEALNIFKQTKDIFFTGTTYYHLGETYLSKQNYEFALEHFLKADSLLKAYPYHLFYIETQQQIGAIYLARQQYDKAEVYFKKMLNSNGNNSFLSKAYNNLSGVNLKKENFIAAKNYALKAIDHARKRQQKNDHLIALEYLLKAHLGLKEYAVSENIQKEIIVLSSNIQQELQQKTLSDLKLSYQIKRQKEELERENQRTIRDREWNRRFSWFLGIIFICISVLLLQGIYYSKKQNKILSNKNKEIANLNENLEQKVDARTRDLQASQEESSLIYNNTQDFMGMIRCVKKGEFILESFNQTYANYLTELGLIKKNKILREVKMQVFLKDILKMSEEEAAEQFYHMSTAYLSKNRVNYQSTIGSVPSKSTYEVRLTPIIDDKKNTCERIIFVMRDITEKIKVDKALADSEKRLSIIYNSSQDLIGLIRPDNQGDYIIESLNQPTLDFLTSIEPSLNPKDFIGMRLKTLFENVHGLSKEVIDFRLKNIDKVFTEHEYFKMENAFIVPTKGFNLFFEAVISPIINTEGACTRALFSAKNITKQKRAELELKASEAHSKTLFEHSPIIIWEEDFSEVKAYFESLPKKELANIRNFFDQNPAALEQLAALIKVVDVNQKSIDFYGEESKDQQLYNLPSYFIEESWEVLKEEMIALANGASSFESEIMIKSPKGELLRLIISLTIPPEYMDTWKSVLVSFVDITEREKVKENLITSEKQLSTIYNSSQDIISLVRLDEKGDYIVESYNKPAKDLLIEFGVHCDQKEILGKSMNWVFETLFGLSKEIVAKRVQILDTVFLNHKAINYKTSLAPPGKDIPINYETILSPVFDSDGKCTHALYVAKNITESEIAKNKLVSSEKQLSSIFEGTNDQMAIFEVRPDGAFIFEATNRSFKEGWKRVNPRLDLEKVYGKNMRFYLREVMRLKKTAIEKRLNFCHQSIKERKSYIYEEVFLAHNNKKYFLDVTISPILNEEDVCEKLLLVTRDVTLKHKAKEQMISNILETEDRERSRFAKELHDSLGQILTASSLNFNFVKKNIDKLDSNTEKRFSLGVKFLKEAIDESRNIAHNLMPQAISDFGYVLSIESLLENLIQTTDIEFTFYNNLNKGRLSVDLELSLYRITQEAINNILKHADATVVSIQLIKHSNSVILTIEDNGKGFNTKTPLRESFGLNSMKNRTSALSGVIDIDGIPGKGTSITLEIPI